MLEPLQDFETNPFPTGVANQLDCLEEDLEVSIALVVKITSYEAYITRTVLKYISHFTMSSNRKLLLKIMLTRTNRADTNTLRSVSTHRMIIWAWSGDGMIRDTRDI